MSDPKEPKTKETEEPGPPPEPGDFTDFLQEINTKNLMTFDSSTLIDMCDNGLQGKFKDQYGNWFKEKVTREIMEEDGNEEEDK